MSKEQTGAEKSTANRKNGAAPDGATVIKKYANRRLYNTATSSYVTLDFLADMVKKGEDFVVFDAKSGTDITHSVLTQIIFEEESKGQNLLPSEFLRQLISFYGDSLQNFVPSYLEMSMNAFAQNQEEMRKRMRETFGAATGFSSFEDSIKKNMELYGQAMKMFSPMANMYGAAMPSAPSEPSGSHNDEEITELKAQLAALQDQLEQLTKKN